MIDRLQLREIDWILIGLLLVNSLFGVILIYSSSHYVPGNFFLRQLMWILVSLAVLFVTLAIDYKALLAYSPYLYGLFVLILLGLLVFGRAISGARSWVRVAFFGGQPSELAKIAVLLVLARIFSEFRRPYLTTGFALLSAALVFLLVGLVGLQPDLGTAITFLPLLVACFLMAGLRKKTLVIILVLTLAGSLVGWNFFLKDYQKKRLTTLVNPGLDPAGRAIMSFSQRSPSALAGCSAKAIRKARKASSSSSPLGIQILFFRC